LSLRKAVMFFLFLQCDNVYLCIYACVVGIKAPESLCYLLMYLNPTLNRLLTYLRSGLLVYNVIFIGGPNRLGAGST
jgi:hypothetical protein